MVPRRLICPAAALASLLATAALPAQDLEVIPVQGKVYMLQTPQAGGNMGVLPGPDGVLLVDDQVPQWAEGVVRGVRRITDEPIRFVVNTHVHIDHIGGNSVMAGLGATIVAQENVHARMLRRLRIPRGGGTFFPQPVEDARPVMTFGETATLRLNGEEVRIFHVPPAHTDGDSFVYFVDSDVLHTGDVFRTNMYPIVDVYNGGTVAGMIEAMQVAVDVAGPNTKVIPGHGFGFTDRNGLIEVLEMLTDVRDTVRDMVADGLWLEEVIAARPTSAYDARWRGTESWTELDLIPIIYSEVGGAAPTVLQAQELPPAYPRPGATLMLENDRVLVWNIAWLQQEYPLHRHLYDHVGVYYAPGDRIITSTEGVKRPVSTEAWNLSFQLRGVTHMEEGASEEPLRAVFVQIKQEPRSTPDAAGGPPTFPVDDPLQRLDNDRTTVWEYGSGAASGRAGRHRHAHDAVVVSFDTALRPVVSYLERGTVHETDVPTGSTRTLVFEIK